VRAAAGALGGGSDAYATHVKGMEIPYHDPRAETSMAANYATGTRGACHLSSLTYAAMWGNKLDGLYLPDPYNQHSSAGKGRMAAEWQNFMTVLNAVGICKLVAKTYVDPGRVSSWIAAGFGWDIDGPELVRAGERIFNLQRLIDARLGVTMADDVLPARLAAEARPDGGSAGVLPDMPLIMEEYYATRGWIDGMPAPPKLLELGLA